MCRSANSQTEETVGRSTHADLTIGSEVLVQNNDTKKWDRSGLVVEVCPFRQYKVKLHGSGRVTLRNRIHLRPLLVFKPTTISRNQLQVQPAPHAASSTGGTISTRSEVTSRLESVQPTTPSVSTDSSSYRPPSSDISSQMSARSRSPLAARRTQRRRQEPVRYGDWAQ